MCQVETSQSLEGVFRGGLMNRGKNVQKDSIHCINCQGHQSFLEPDKWLVKFDRKCSYEGTHSMRYSFGIGIFFLTEAGEQQIDWVPEKD